MTSGKAGRKAVFLFFILLSGVVTFTTNAHAQNSVLITSGMGGGASSTARLTAQMAQERGRVNSIEKCGNKGRLFGPSFGGAKDGDGCLTHMSVNSGGGTSVSGGLSASGGLTATGNGTFNNNLTVKGTTESDGRVYADDGLHVRGDWVRVDGNKGIYFQGHGGGWHMSDGTWVRAYNNKGVYTGGNIRTGGQFQINGNTFGPAPTCTTSQKLRWTGSAWQCINDLIGEGGASETDPQVGSLANGRWCTSNGSTINCTSNQPIISESDPQVATLQSGKWCTSNGSQVNCTSNPPLTSKSDPQVGTLTNGRWCTSNGSVVSCTASPPVTSESDPQVGSLSNGKWCTSNGSSVNCTSNPPGTPTCTRRTGYTGGDTATASCLAGEIMTGGGCQHGGAKEWRKSYPSSNTTWYCQSAGSAMTAYAICCNF